MLRAHHLSNRIGLPRAVLDTQVIFSRVLHELLGRLASELRLMNLIWSDELLDEAARVLAERKPMDAEIAARWVSYMRVAFPDGKIDITTVDPSVELDTMTVDADDRHVCALAIAGQADLLIASDKGYNSPVLKRHGVQLVTPDAYLLHVFEEDPKGVAEVLAAQAGGWAGGRRVSELLDALERAQAIEFVAAVRQSHECDTDSGSAGA